MSTRPVEPGPTFEEDLRRSQISTSGWETDFSRHSVPYSEILSGGVPRDGIPPLDDPRLTTTEEAARWLENHEPVVALEINGEARAYPLQILTWHEIVNDLMAGVPVAATFCPLCNSALVFDRSLNGEIYDFGVSGNLRNSDLIMWDRQTQSWWQQLTGEAIVGLLTGNRLTLLPSAIISWEDFKAAYPDGSVLSRETGFTRNYGENPYAGYDRADNPPFLFLDDPDGRLLPKERVVAVTINGEAAAFPYTTLERERVVNHTIGGQDLVVFFKPGTRSALDKAAIKESREVGSTAVYEASVDGQKLSFDRNGEGFADTETGSLWTHLGEAFKGPSTGSHLSRIAHADPFWFVWAAFKPNTFVYDDA